MTVFGLQGAVLPVTYAARA